MVVALLEPPGASHANLPNEPARYAMNQITCLILTTAHHRDDARLTRHVDTLNRHGISTTLIADVRRPPWRRLVMAPWSAWSHLRSVRPDAVLLPDPELYVAGTLVARLLGIRAIIDIHEDYAAVAADRDWIPKTLRPVVGSLTRLVTMLGRRFAHSTVVAADHLRHPGDLVVPNVPALHFFPDPTDVGARPTAVYVGDITISRGAHAMVDLLDLVPDLHLELIGPITSDLRADLMGIATRKGAADRLHVTGRLPYREAWQRAAGAAAGLALLQDTPAYRSALPTKVWEYMAAGIPVIATALPAQMQLLNETGAGVLVGSTEGAAQCLTAWLADPGLAAAIGRKGRIAYEAQTAKDGGAEALIAAVSG